MMQTDREQEVKRALTSYEEYVQEVKDYEDQIIFGSKDIDITGVHGTGISDPSAKKAMALTDMPRYLQRKRSWIEAIDDGLEELSRMDNGNKKGLRFICTRMYGIPTKNVALGTVRISIECNMSRSAIYSRLQTINNVMMFHAAAKGLL